MDTAIFTPLLELGIYNLADLVEKTRADPASGCIYIDSWGSNTIGLIDTATLTDLYGGRATVRDAHRVALNRLMKLLHSHNEGVDHVLEIAWR